MTVVSMTGFGQAEADCGTRTIRVEIRSVNHRFSDLVVRAPRDCGLLEERCRNYLQERIWRGRVEAAVVVNERAKQTRVEVDYHFIAQLRDAELKLLDGQMQSPAAPYAWLSFPGVVTTAGTVVDQEALWTDVGPVLAKAANNWLAAREREGARIHTDLMEKLEQIRALQSALRALMPAVTKEAEQRLRDRIGKLAAAVDDTRLWTEVAFLLDKLSIDEELLRLSAHIDEFERAIAGSEAVGRRLDFLIQEMNREVNTIGSKSVSAEVSRMVVDTKTVIEQMREQVQNIA